MVMSNPRYAPRLAETAHLIDRTRTIGLLSAMVALGVGANAQDVPWHIRFVIVAAPGDVRWEGDLEWLTPDSLGLRLRDADSTAVFPRTLIGSVERERPVHQGQAAGVGCLTGGIALGVLGLVGTHDPDSPGLETNVGALGAVVGCGLGAVGGLLISATHHGTWEPWSLPDSISGTVPPTRRLEPTRREGIDMGHSSSAPRGSHAIR